MKGFFLRPSGAPPPYGPRASFWGTRRGPLTILPNSQELGDLGLGFRV